MNKFHFLVYIICCFLCYQVQAQTECTPTVVSPEITSVNLCVKSGEPADSEDTETLALDPDAVPVAGVQSSYANAYFITDTEGNIVNGFASGIDVLDFSDTPSGDYCVHHINYNINDPHNFAATTLEELEASSGCFAYTNCTEENTFFLSTYPTVLITEPICVGDGSFEITITVVNAAGGGAYLYDQSVGDFVSAQVFNNNESRTIRSFSLSAICILPIDVSYSGDAPFGPEDIDAAVDNVLECVTSIMIEPPNCIECIDESQINPDLCVTDEYIPVCGCDGITYGNACEAEFGAGVLSWTEGTCTTACVDEELINEEVFCLDLYDPVCGCDGNTYENACKARYDAGINTWTNGPCLSACLSDDPLNDLPWLSDYVENQGCCFAFRIFRHIVDGEVYFQVSGAPGGPYDDPSVIPCPEDLGSEYFNCQGDLVCYAYPLIDETDPGLCSNAVDFSFGLGDLIYTCGATECNNPSLLNENIPCEEITENPVCGCDGITYINACSALYQGGVASYTYGACVEGTFTTSFNDELCITVPENYNASEWQGDDTNGFTATRTDNKVVMDYEIGPGTPFLPATLNTPLPASFIYGSFNLETQKIIYTDDTQTEILGVFYYTTNTNFTFRDAIGKYFKYDGTAYQEILTVSFASNTFNEVCSILSSIDSCACETPYNGQVIYLDGNFGDECGGNYLQVPGIGILEDFSGQLAALNPGQFVNFDYVEIPTLFATCGIAAEITCLELLGPEDCEHIGHIFEQNDGDECGGNYISSDGSYFEVNNQLIGDLAPGTQISFSYNLSDVGGLVTCHTPIGLNCLGILDECAYRGTVIELADENGCSGKFVQTNSNQLYDSGSSQLNDLEVGTVVNFSFVELDVLVASCGNVVEFTCLEIISTPCDKIGTIVYLDENDGSQCNGLYIQTEWNNYGDTANPGIFDGFSEGDVVNFSFDEPFLLFPDNPDDCTANVVINCLELADEECPYTGTIIYLTGEDGDECGGNYIQSDDFGILETLTGELYNLPVGTVVQFNYTEITVPYSTCGSVIELTCLEFEGDDCIDLSLAAECALIDCAITENPVCGCDGVTYTDACSAMCGGLVGSITYGPCDANTGGDCTVIADFNFEYLGSEGPSPFFPENGLHNFCFEDLSQGNITHWYWDFGNPDYLDVYYDQNPCDIGILGAINVADFSQEICLTVYDEVSNCIDTYCENINGGLGCINPDSVDPDANCILVYDPVCGCDGVTYQNSCFASIAGVQEWTNGECGSNGCFTNDPLSELDWLSNIAQGCCQGPDCCQALSIVQYEYEGEFYFQVNYSPNSFDYDVCPAIESVSQVYDCGGNLLCSMGFVPVQCDTEEFPFLLTEGTTLLSCPSNNAGTCDDPSPAIEQYPWVPAYFEELGLNEDCACGYVAKEYCWNGDPVIIFELQPAPDVACNDFQTFIFDANGDQICISGGITGGDCFELYPNLFDEIEFIETFWSCGNDPCSTLGPTCALPTVIYYNDIYPGETFITEAYASLPPACSNPLYELVDDFLYMTIATEPTYGVVEVIGDQEQEITIQYTANDDFVGEDYYTYEMCYSYSNPLVEECFGITEEVICFSQTVYFNVLEDCLYPVCTLYEFPKELYINQGEESTINAYDLLPAFCLHPETQFFEEYQYANIISWPNNGDLIVDGDENESFEITYIPNEGFIGDDQYTYELCYSYSDPVVEECFNITDGVICLSQTIYITVTDGFCINADQIEPFALCTEEYFPVCGCDGVTYSNECHATASGVTTFTLGECNEGGECNFEDPLTDLEWLSSIVANGCCDGPICCEGLNVYQYEYEGEYYFEISNAYAGEIDYTVCPVFEFVSTLYDCNGNALCNMGFVPVECNTDAYPFLQTEGTLLFSCPPIVIGSPCENPWPAIEQYPWVNEVIADNPYDCACNYAATEYCANGEPVIIFGPNPNEPIVCADVQSFVYDGEGNLICIDGGISGGDCVVLYPELYDELELIETFWICDDISPCDFPICDIAIFPMEIYVNQGENYTISESELIPYPCTIPLFQFTEELQYIDIIEAPTNGTLDTTNSEVIYTANSVGEDTYTYQVCYSYSDPLVEECFGITDELICFNEIVSLTVTDGECIDANQIEPFTTCATVSEPVCGCDGVTYSNECYATVNGVTNFTEGACENPCEFDVCDVEVLPTEIYLNQGETHIINEFGLIPYSCTIPLFQFAEEFQYIDIIATPLNGTLEVEGSDIIYTANEVGADEYTYQVCYNYSSPLVEECFGITTELICFNETVYVAISDGECIDADQINPFAICTQEAIPVCGCDGQTYVNACYATNSGVTSFTSGVCDNSGACDDLSIIAYETCSDVTDCGYCESILFVEATGGTGEYIFSTPSGQLIYNGMSAFELSNIGLMTTIVVTDSEGCSVESEEFEVTLLCCDAPPPYPEYLSISTYCENDNGIINIYSDGFLGGGPESYTLQDQFGNTYIDGDIIEEGEYILTATSTDFPDCNFFTEELVVNCGNIILEPDYVNVCGTETIEIFPLSNDIVTTSAGMCGFSIPQYGGVLSFNNNNGFYFTPNANYNGILNVIYTVCDGVEFASETLTINIMNENPAPIMTETNYSSDGSPVFILSELPTFDTNNPYCEINNPAEGTLVSTAGGFIYVPDGNYTGIVELSFSTCEFTPCGTITHTQLVTIDILSPTTDLGSNAENDCLDADIEVCTTPMTPIILCPEYCELNENYEIVEVEVTYTCSITLLEDGCIRYIPLPGFTGWETLTVTACDSDNCQDAFYDVFTGDCSNGSGFTEENNSFKSEEMLEQSTFEMELYPNPNNGIFNVSLNTANTQETLLEIFNYNGQQVLQRSIPTGIIEQTINLSDYPKGIYLVSLNDGENKIIKKLMVN